MFPALIQAKNSHKKQEKHHSRNYPKSTIPNQAIAIWRDAARTISLYTVPPFPVAHVKNIKEECRQKPTEIH